MASARLHARDFIARYLRRAPARKDTEIERNRYTLFALKKSMDRTTAAVARCFCSAPLRESVSVYARSVRRYMRARRAAEQALLALLSLDMPLSRIMFRFHAAIASYATLAADAIVADATLRCITVTAMLCCLIRHYCYARLRAAAAAAATLRYGRHCHFVTPSYYYYARPRRHYHCCRYVTDAATLRRC